MQPRSNTESNVFQAVPFFGVTDMPSSVHFYVDGLGFRMTRQWTPEGELRWCWLELGEAAIMLQTFYREGQGPYTPDEKLGAGVTISFQCRDALAIYHAAKDRGLNPSRPFVGNQMWVTALSDPDGYRLEFESPTDAPEESVYNEDDER